MGRDQLFQGQLRMSLVIRRWPKRRPWKILHTGVSISIVKSRMSLIWSWDRDWGCLKCITVQALNRNRKNGFPRAPRRRSTILSMDVEPTITFPVETELSIVCI